MDHEIAAVLDDPVFHRADASEVGEALARLGCKPSKRFRAFYEAYRGMFDSPHTGFGLLDICNRGENIVTQTEIVRKQFAFPQRYLVISDYLGNAVLVYDCQTDAVFNVDFEGSDQELIEGTLEPRWRSFDEFLASYFLGR